jgi:Fe-S cluster assembly iron-binding protein IscA
MKADFTFSSRALKALRNMTNYVSSKHEEVVALISLPKVPGTDVTQCVVTFVYKKNLPDGCIEDIQGLPITIEEEDAETLAGKEIDYEDGQFLVS